MEPATSRPIAPLDSIWLSMDRPNNLMVIVSVILLGEVPDWDEVTEMVRDRVIDQYPVFRQRPEPASLPGGRPRWVDDDDFDIARHIRRVIAANLITLLPRSKTFRRRLKPCLNAAPGHLKHPFPLIAGCRQN